MHIYAIFIKVLKGDSEQIWKLKIGNTMNSTYNKTLAWRLLLALVIVLVCTVMGQGSTDRFGSPFLSAVAEQPPRLLQHEVSGTVTDANAEPLPGVNIQVKGTTMGTSSGVEGEYELVAPSGSDTLLF